MTEQTQFNGTGIDLVKASSAATSYLPVKIVKELASGIEYPSQRIEQLRGAAMFCDLVGFTLFVLSLCTLGKRGIEALQATLSAFYKDLIDCIYRYGGDVYHFAGDAVLVGFCMDKRESDSECAGRAVNCAVQIQALSERYDNIEILGSRYSLQVKIGLGLGTYDCILMGGESSWYTAALLGRPVDAAIKAEGEARGGDILLDQELWKLLSEPKSGEPAGSFIKLLSAPTYSGRFYESYKVPQHEVNEDLLLRCARFVEPVLFTNSIKSHADYDAEYREVTCLFARFTDISVEHDVNSTFKRLNGIYRFVQECGRTYGAILNRTELGDKGYAFLFLIGALTAVENRCLVAGRLALRLANHGLSYVGTVQVGIATGYGYCANVGGPTRREYTVTGEVVNLAARLMTYGDGNGIYLDRATQDRLHSTLLTRDIPEVTLKGLSAPTTIYQLLGEIERRRGIPFLYTDRLIGRQNELGMLSNLWSKVRAREGQTCAIVGEPGIGKSRMASALFEQAALEQSQVLAASCFSHEQYTPYYAWKQILLQFFDVTEDMPQETVVNAVQTAFGELSGISNEWAPVFARIMGITVEETPLTRNLNPNQKARRTFQIVCELLERRAARSPLLLCFEDVHWMDDLSLKLLGTVVRRIESYAMLLLLMSRSEAPVAGMQAVRSFHLLRLERLPEESVRELLAERLPTQRTHRRLEGQILEKAQGNPFFIESIARSFEERGYLVSAPDGSKKLLADADEILIPDTLQDLILLRIDRLDQDQKTILRVASVIGRIFDCEMLKKLIPATLVGAVLDEALTIFQEADLTLRASGASPAFYFKHSLIRDVAYDTLSLNTRERLHHQIGRDIEASAHTRSKELADQLAYHFLAGNELEKGLEYTIIAARQATAKFANEEAIYHFRRALGVLTSEAFSHRRDERLDVQQELAEAYRQTGEYRKAKDLFSACLESHISSFRHADVHMGLGHVYQEQGQAAQAIDELETALNLLGKWVPRSRATTLLAILSEFGLHVSRQALSWSRRPVRVEEVAAPYRRQYAVLDFLSKVYFFRELEKTAWAVVSQVNVAERLQSATELSLAYSNLALAMMARGHLKAASVYSRRSLAVVEQTNNPIISAQVYMRTGTLGLYTGDALQSQRGFQKGIGICKQIGEMWEQLSGLGGLGAAYAFSTEFTRAVEVFAEMETLATELDSQMHLGWAKCWQPFFRYLLGEEIAAESGRQIESAIRCCRQCNDFSTEILVGGHLCAIAVREGDVKKAGRLADETFKALWRNRRRLPARTPQIAWVHAAEAAMFAIEYETDTVALARLHRIARRCIRAATKIGKNFAYVRGPALRVGARYAAITKGATRAVRPFAHALRVLEDGPDRWQTALAYCDAARSFKDKAEEYSDKARRLLVQHNLQAELRRFAKRWGA